MRSDCVSIVTIGDELLLGQITDTNSSWLGLSLASLGWNVVSKYTIGDRVDDITLTLNRASKDAAIVLVSGGLGPTSDDMTLLSIAKFFNCDLVVHEHTRKRIKSYFENKNRTMSAQHARQYTLPEIAEVLDNNVGTAPGLRIHQKGILFYFFPGVPTEMKFLFNTYVLPSLKSLNQERVTLFTAGIGETDVVDTILDIIKEFPRNISIAYLPYHGGVRLRLTEVKEKGSGHSKINYFKEKIITRLQDFYIAENHNEWATIMGELLKERGLMMATGESCTGGYIAHKITSVPGASEYFLGSVISYANEIKENLLNVSSHVLDTYGAVSEECAREMLAGLCNATNCDIGIVTTGIAGPGGGTKDKPVGTVFVAVGNKERILVQKFSFRSSRAGIIEHTFNRGMHMIYKFLSKG
ncbi:CinA family nicotinamide mononucleotide deamidase-related protein [Membranihabitans maritimus]|uniref:CinA family nicotinamide mononucleotide deamidase-related protein n=1 Tax=Membranihabitans maritimus TaxID=2904244 RepID=UPI001F37759D|nr:CinA family nicotinamide mononucleotide deamidase-related protein [Membranihabitans maritimus]